MNSKVRTINITIFSFWLILFGGVPLLLLLVTSFLEQHPEQFFQFGFSVKAYSQIFNPTYLEILIRSLRLAATCMFICLAIGCPFAWLTCKLSSRHRLAVLILLMIPFWTNSLIRTYAVRLLLGTKGLLNNTLLATGIIESPIRFMYTDFAVVLGLVYLMLPFMILPLYSNMEKFDFKLVEAAKDLGAGRIYILKSIIFPLTLPGVIAGCIMVFVPTMGLFYVATLLGGSKNLLIGNLIQQKFLVSQNWPVGSAMSTILILIMFSMFLLYWLVLRRFSTRRPLI